jgi:hypothetical protein
MKGENPLSCAVNLPAWQMLEESADVRDVSRHVKVLVSLRRKINASIKLHHCCF